ETMVGAVSSITRKANVDVTVPAIVVNDVTVAGPSSAQVGATVDPNGLPTTVHFEYGANNVLNMRTPSVSIGAGVDPTKVAADLLDLQPGTSYSYRVVAESASGTTTGPSQTFTTPPAGSGSEATGGFVVSLSSGTLRHGAYVVGKSARCTITGSKRG